MGHPRLRRGFHRLMSPCDDRGLTDICRRTFNLVNISSNTRSVFRRPVRCVGRLCRNLGNRFRGRTHNFCTLIASFSQVAKTRDGCRNKARHGSVPKVYIPPRFPFDKVLRCDVDGSAHDEPNRENNTNRTPPIGVRISVGVVVGIKSGTRRVFP